MRVFLSSSGRAIGLLISWLADFAAHIIQSHLCFLMAYPVLWGILIAMILRNLLVETHLLKQVTNGRSLVEVGALALESVFAVACWRQVFASRCGDVLPAGTGV